MQRDKTRGLNFGALRNENLLKCSKVGKSLTHVRETDTLAFGLSLYQHAMSHWQLQRRGKQIFFLLWQKLPSLMMSFLTQIAELWNESNCPVCFPRDHFQSRDLTYPSLDYLPVICHNNIQKLPAWKKKKKSLYILNVRHPKNYFHNINLLTIWIFLLFSSLSNIKVLFEIKSKDVTKKELQGLHSVYIEPRLTPLWE